MTSRALMHVAGLWLAFTGVAGAANTPATATEDLKPFEEARTQRYAEQLEAWLRDWLVNQYPQRAGKAWQRDYSSLDAFLASVEPNRRRWNAVLNPPDLKPTGPLRKSPHQPLADLGGEWLSLPLGGLDAEAVLVAPKSAKPVPLVIAQHGIGSFPERPPGTGQGASNCVETTP